MNTGINDGKPLTREQVITALTELSDELGRRRVTGEICIFGGSAMVLAFAARVTTKDVDAIFEPAGLIRDLARVIAARCGLPDNWLNDGVKGFVSARPETTAEGLPEFPHLRLTVPVPEYLLAMKCMAARIGGTTDEPSDTADIVFLIRQLRLRSAREVLDIVSRYYPADRISVKSQYLIEGLFEEGRV